jgi:hypothetical protein
MPAIFIKVLKPLFVIDPAAPFICQKAYETRNVAMSASAFGNASLFCPFPSTILLRLLFVIN